MEASRKVDDLWLLANMVATIPHGSRCNYQNELDVAPESGSSMDTEGLDSVLTWSRPGTISSCRPRGVRETSDEPLEDFVAATGSWQVSLEAPRFEMMQDTINHWTHHRGQMTVYRRLWVPRFRRYTVRRRR